MGTILIIEPSATLRYGIRRSIHLPGFDLQEEHDCRQAILRLSCLPQQTPPPAAIVLGWPALANTQFKSLAKLLCESPCNKIPLLLIVQDLATREVSDLFQREFIIVQKVGDMDESTTHLNTLLLNSEGQREEADPQVSDKIRILLVDDSKTIRVQFGTLLKREGYCVEVAATPSEAYQKAQQQRFDIGIIDYYMPEQNGAELCAQLKANVTTRGMDLAVLTGSYDDELVSSVLASGAIECMFKNESSQLFLARVSALVRICEQRKIISQEKEQLDNILTSVGEGVYGVNQEGVVSFINPAALKILGYESENKLLGQYAHSLFHYADQSGKAVDPDCCFLHQAYQLGDELLQWEAVFWTAKGAAIPVECSIRPRLVEGRCIGSVVAFRDVSERLLFEEELKWQVNHDHLTKLLNRQYLEQALEQETRRLFRTGETSALLFIDLDRFKQVNDQAGHAAGDQLLVEVSNKLKERVRQSDIIARVAGDEFVVILSNVNLEQALVLAEKLRGILDETLFHYEDLSFDITGSVGLAMMDAGSFSVERVLANADAACHIAKLQGRNKIHVFDEQTDSSGFDQKEQGWIKNLESALSQKLFTLSFHPVYLAESVEGLLDHAPHSAEDENDLFIRLARPCAFYEVRVQLPDKHGLLMHASTFMPIAERFDLAAKIDMHVIERVITLCGQQASAQRFAIAVTEQTLLQPDFIQRVDQALKRFFLTPERILFTVCGSLSGANTKPLQQVINHLHGEGYGVILDEQTREQSAFAHLRGCNASCITISERFLDGLLTDPIDQAVVRATIDVSHAQNRKTLARNMTSLATCRLLYQLKVDYLQSDLLGEWISEEGFARSKQTACHLRLVT
ncbi:MAG: diguanylate cyclase [Sedimenticola sp.]|nr:diguanylate cyclase [Sedimenticola sp.]